MGYFPKTFMSIIRTLTLQIISAEDYHFISGYPRGIPVFFCLVLHRLPN